MREFFVSVSLPSTLRTDVGVPVRKWRWIGKFTMATAVVVAAGCGSKNASSPTTPSAPTEASITVTAAPNPATASACSPVCVSANGNSYQFRVTGTLTIQETAGVAGNVDSIVSGSITFTSADLGQRSGTSRVAANGSLIFPLDFVFGAADNANASRTGVFPISVSFTDDRGNHLTRIIQWAVS